MKDASLMYFVLIGSSALFVGLIATMAFFVNPNVPERSEKMIGTVQGWNGRVYLEHNGQRELLDSPKYAAPYPLQSGDRIFVPDTSNPVRAELTWNNGEKTILGAGTYALVDDLERPRESP